MNRILIRIEKAHCQRLDLHVLKFPQYRRNIFYLDWQQDPAVAGHAFGNFLPEKPWNQGFRIIRKNIIGIITEFSSQFQNIPEALRGDKTGSGAFSFDDSIDHQGCPMDKFISKGHESGRVYFELTNTLCNGCGRV